MIERFYAAEIHKWSKRAQKDISHLPDFVTNKKTWTHSIQASELIAESHYNIAQNIQRAVVDQMVNYKELNYDASILHVKTAKEFEKEFENVQRSWLKLLDKLERAKKAYHEACRKTKKNEPSGKSKKLDTSGSKGEKNNVTDTDIISNKELMALRTEYKTRFYEMESNRPIYECAMKQILDRMSQIERKRLDQFKRLFAAYHDAVDMKKDAYLSRMSTELKEAIQVHNIESDLQEWHDLNANDANNSWPVFEEFTV